MTSVLPEPFIELRSDDLAAESAAAACLQECCTALGLHRLPIPVPVENWIEHPLRMDMEFTELDPWLKGYNLSGTKVIRLNSSLADRVETARWTAAHELGHARMHTPKSPRMPLSDADYFNLYVNTTERQAERFAAAFLIPPTELVEELFRLCREHRFDEQETLETLMSDTRRAAALWRDIFVPRLCRAFLVSPFGLLFRLGELRLADQAPFMHPRHLFVLSAELRSA